MKRKLIFKIGLTMMIIGPLVDQFIYHIVMLPGLGESKGLYVTISDVLSCYESAISWVGVSMIIVGLMLVIAGKWDGV